MRKTSSALLTVTLLAVLLAAFFTAPGSARAMCVYNNTTHPISVTIEWLDRAIWKIGPTQHRCTKGTGGTLWVSVMEPFRKWIISTDAMMKVDDHGWVSAYKKNDGKWKVESKNRHGSIKQTKYMKPLPGAVHLAPSDKTK